MDAAALNLGQVYLVLGLILCSLILFSTDRLSPDVVALGLAFALIFSGLLDPKEAFSGFGSDTVVVIIGLLILTAALLRTGIVDVSDKFIITRTDTRLVPLLVVIMTAAAFLSAFMSNTASTVVKSPRNYP